MPGVDYHLATLRKIKAYLPDWAIKEIHTRALAKSGGKARWRQGGAERYGPEGLTKEYLEATYEIVSKHRDLVPTWLLNRLRDLAFPASGGIAKGRKHKSVQEAKESKEPPISEPQSEEKTGALKKDDATPPDSEKEGTKKGLETPTAETELFNRINAAYSDSPKSQAAKPDTWETWITEKLANGGNYVGETQSDGFRSVVLQTDDGRVHMLSEEIAKIDLSPSLPLTKEDQMPRIAFISGSPDSLEAGRGQPMVGHYGRAFKEQYLAPLGLEKEEVALLNVIPSVLRDRKGGVRGPSKEEVLKWLPWLNKELRAFNPDLTIALGHSAANALPVDVVLPHPRALTKSSKVELSRKIKWIQKWLTNNGPTATKVAARINLANSAKEAEKKVANRGVLYKKDTSYNFDHTFELLSADDDENRLVTGVVYKPDELDTQREWAPPAELEKAARWWMEHSQATGIRHLRRAEARVTQSYIAPQDVTIGNRLVKAGSWIVELHILAKKLWQEIKDGVYNAFSMGGHVTRTPGELPPGMSKAEAGDPSTINALSDIQPLEITLCAAGANKEKRFPLLKCAMCALES
jgi:uracil-DNA glycosylase family 4